MRPLAPGDIRLLRIEAGTRPAPIRTTLGHMSLDSLPAYDALSYCWGPEGEDLPIICDDQKLFVRQNLFKALPFLRLADRERVIWIDAVCIDQKNEKEKTQQMGHMKLIYERASQVVIWLGTDPGADKRGFAMLENFNRAIAINNKYVYDLEGSYEDGLLPPVESSAWTALIKLFRRDWFFRVWVIQEAVSAKNLSVVCGNLSVNWQHIVQVSRVCRETGLLGGYTTESPVRGTHSAAVIDLLKSPGNGVTLLKLLALTRCYKATDPKDKVFALLDIASDGGSFEKYDYAHSTKHVFYSVAHRSLFQKKPFACLSSAGLSTTPRELQLPTWVPDWTNPNDNRVVIADSDCFSAAKTTTADWQICGDEKTLRIRGYAIDTISSINDSINEVDEELTNPALPVEFARVMLSGKRKMESWDKLIARAFGRVIDPTPKGLAATAMKYFTGVSPIPAPVVPEREEALWRTACCDLTPTGERAPARYAGGAQVYRMAFRLTDNNGVVHRWMADKALFDRHHFDARNYATAVRKYCTGRNLCVTRRGRLGNVPHSVSKVGDKICIFKGGDVPFVLRDVGNGYHQLVGECYVHGIMDGELMSQGNITSYEQDFWIR